MAGLNIPFHQYLNFVGLPFYDILDSLSIHENKWDLLSSEYSKSSAINIDKIDFTKMFYQFLLAFTVPDFMLAL